MKCDKCGYENIDINDICENCKSPLTGKEEKKNLLPKKGKHIDIEDFEEEKEQPSFNQTKKSVKNFLLFLLIVILLAITYLVSVFIIDSFSEEMLEEYDDIMTESQLALIYLGYDEEIDELCSFYASNYSFDYLNIEAKKISLAKKKKLRKELNIYNLTSTLVIIQDGVPIEYYSKLSSKEELLKFLQKNNLVPEIIEDTTSTLESFTQLILASEDTIIYLPTNYNEKTNKKSDSIKKIAEENNLNYGEVKGYILSQKQLKNIMSRIGFSEIQDDLIIYVRDSKVIDVLHADKTDENHYFNLFVNRGIINVVSNEGLADINKNNFSNIVKEKKTNVIFISTKDNSYCERVQTILTKIANQNNISIYHLDATNDKDKISNIIKDIGYEDGLTVTPFVLIVENNKYIDSIIGLADQDIYIYIFTEYGVIK